MNYISGMQIVLIPILFIAAFIAAMLGIGGGVLYTPLQVIFGVDIHNAAANSLFLIMVLSLTASMVYRRAKKIDWALALVLEIFTATGGLLGGFFSEKISSVILIWILASVLLISSICMFFDYSTTKACTPRKKRFFVWHRRLGEINYNVNMLLAIPICLAAGALSGLVGIGGGVIKVPMMVVLLGIPMNIAVATSAFMVGVTSLFGFIGHIPAGHFEWKTAAILTPSVLIGSFLGAKFMLRTSSKKLKILFGVLVLCIAIFLSIKQLKWGG